MISLTQVVETFDPSAAFAVPPNWLQGRTVYGGLSAALAVQAFLKVAPPELPALRSGHVSFIGPATEALSFQPRLLRQGKSVVSASVDVFSGDELSLRVALVFARPRASRVAHDFSKRPPVKGPDAYAALTAEDKRIAPASAHNFEMRMAGGSLPVSGAANPELLFWVRHLDARGVDPTVALVALADGLPPAAFTSFTEPAPISSMTWTFDLLQAAPQGEWFLLRAFSQHAGDGYSIQDMEIWDEGGRPVLWGRQMVAIFA